MRPKQAPLADWGGNELIIRLQAGSIPAGRTESSKSSNRGYGALGMSSCTEHC